MCPSAAQVPGLFDLMPPYTVFWTVLPFVLFLLYIPVAGVRKAVQLFHRFAQERPPLLLRWLEGLFYFGYLANLALGIFLFVWFLLLFEWAAEDPTYRGCPESPFGLGLKTHVGDDVWLIVAFLMALGLRGIQKLHQTKSRTWSSEASPQEGT